ncbi:MAG: PilZ domain-containing protein [Methylococcales bacterium]|nr:PilZ domain-containing protein [Methylococcales bacterium]
MPENRQHYRKTLTSQGHLYLAGEELRIAVKNYSIAGVLVEIAPNPTIKNVDDFQRAINSTELVDIYLQDMRLAAEMSVVRVDMVGDSLQVVMAFVHVSYDVDEIFYKRKAYRKRLKVSGLILLNDHATPFKTINASLDGFMIHLDSNVTVLPGLVTTFVIESERLSGKVAVMWAEHDADGGVVMGLQYIHMAKESGLSPTTH